MAVSTLRRVRNWLIGTARGELSASELSSRGGVGALAYSLAEEAERVRDAPGFAPWELERGDQLFLLCAWNAFALQAIADHLLESDALLDPLTAGLLPETTLEFVETCLGQVSRWIGYARLAQADGEYRVRDPLPTPLPAWRQSEPVRKVHLGGLRAAFEAISPRAEHDLGRLRGEAGVGRPRELAGLDLLTARMRTSVELADGLRDRARHDVRNDEVRGHLVEALGYAYTLGQVVAMPSLLEQVKVRAYRTNPAGPSPILAVETGCPVVDCDGAPVGTVVRLEGEPALGDVSGLIVSAGPLAPDHQVRLEHIAALERGLVRLTLTKAELGEI